ncbi:hypothetical protein ACRAWD_10000 [Caulobacter segnis]
MSGLQDEIAEGAIDRAVRDCGPRKPMLCAIIRAAGRMLAESDGHDFVAQICAGEAPPPRLGPEPTRRPFRTLTTSREETKGTALFPSKSSGPKGSPRASGPTWLAPDRAAGLAISPAARQAARETVLRIAGAQLARTEQADIAAGLIESVALAARAARP